MYFHSFVLSAVANNILQIKESIFLSCRLSLKCKSITGVQCFEAKSKRKGKKASVKLQHNILFFSKNIFHFVLTVLLEMDSIIARVLRE